MKTSTKPTMLASSLIALILLFNATSGFQLKHHVSIRPAQSRTTSRVLGGRNLFDGVAENDANALTIQIQRERPAAVTDHASVSAVLVSTRQTFLAKALIASVLTPFSSVSHAYAYEVAASPDSAAIYAYRSGGLPSLRTLGITKLLTRYEGFVEAPKSYKKGQIPITFDFPTDWLQLDKLGGGIQYVDQRNGDKLYVLHATLPEGMDLKNVYKQWFADVILSPDGDVARSGVVAEGGRISRSQMIVDCNNPAEGDASPPPPPPCMARRRLVLKYDTVTGSGVQTVERRGLIDAYQVETDVYMMLTTSNAVKFEQKGSKERETVDNIVNSFKIG